MGSWTCGLCECEERWPSKQAALGHIEDHHLESLLRASLERSDENPTEALSVSENASNSD